MKKNFLVTLVAINIALCFLTGLFYLTGLETLAIITALVTATVMSLSFLALAGITLIYVLAKEKIDFTEPVTDTYQFVVAGETCVRVINGCKNVVINKTTGVIENVTEERRPENLSFLRKQMGIEFYSWMYPVWRIHEFEVIADKSLPGITDVRAKIQKEKRFVQSLRREWQHPRNTLEVELSDGITADFHTLYMVQVVNPEFLVFRRRAIDAIEQIDSWIDAAINNVCNGDEKEEKEGEDRRVSYKELINMSRGVDSPWSKTIIKEVNKRAVKELGLKLISLASDTMQLSPNNPSNAKMAIALASESIEKAEAAGKIAKAKGTIKVAKHEAAALNLKTTADAKRVLDLAVAKATGDQAQAEAYIKTLGPEGAAKVLANAALPANLESLTVIGDKTPVTPVISLERK